VAGMRGETLVMHHDRVEGRRVHTETPRALDRAHRVRAVRGCGEAGFSAAGRHQVSVRAGGVCSCARRW
jgi:hypothetical protein